MEKVAIEIRPNPVLVLDDHRGIYIPRDFARFVEREHVTGVTAEEYEILEDPKHEHYWEVWSDVCESAKLTDVTTGVVYTLYQDGALWLVPEGMEWSDSEDFFAWPDEVDEASK